MVVALVSGEQGVVLRAELERDIRGIFAILVDADLQEEIEAFREIANEISEKLF